MHLKTISMALLLASTVFSMQPLIAAQKNPPTLTSAQATPAKLNINVANLQQLEAIPGIGSRKAEAILAYIKEKGPIKDVTQLTEVKGIGEKLAAKIAEFVIFK